MGEREEKGEWTIVFHDDVEFLLRGKKSGPLDD